MNHQNCCVCGTPHKDALYRSHAKSSLTSLCHIHRSTTTVYACSECGHLQSEAISDIDVYYENDYDILVNSEDEDQVYDVVEGNPVYRTAHQVETFLSKISLPQNAELLDYGCAKGSTIRMLCARVSGLTPHLFDVSARYIPFWKSFALPSNWSVHEIKPEWTSRFDVVTSFFSLEHIPRPADSMREIASLLKPGGFFYAIVPNVFSNIADFIVVDHCNHFTETSLTRLIADSGMDVQEIDTRSHRGAYVITARKPYAGEVKRPGHDHGLVQLAHAEILRIADFWHAASSRIRIYEATLSNDVRIGIYGAGFYGMFISTNLVRPERVACYLDQNPFLQGKILNARPIVPAEALPTDINRLLVGLNPLHAKRIIAQIPALASRSLDYFYL